MLNQYNSQKQPAKTLSTSVVYAAIELEFDIYEPELEWDDATEM